MVKRDKCTGCAACAAACSRHAISMDPGRDGFVYPHVNVALCSKCGVCDVVCPCHKSSSIVPPGQCYAVKARDEEDQRKSSSGGLFYEVARSFLLHRSGIVYGCAYDDHLVARHIRVENLAALERLRDSKYVQSDQVSALGDAVREIKAGRQILYSGTPCQIAGLTAIVGKSVENLLTVEVTCHGVPSPLLFEKFKRDKEIQFGERLVSLSFKSKSDSWIRHRIRLTFASGKVAELPYSLEPYVQAFESRYGNRPSCHACMFNAGASGADLTMGDYWGIQEVHPEFYSDLGVSFAIPRTSKGLAALASAGNVKETIFDSIVRKNPDLVRREPLSLSRHRRFYHAVWRRGIACANSAAWRSPFYRRIAGKVLRFLGLRR